MRQNFYAANTFKRKYHWPMRDVLVKFGFTRKMWMSYRRKYWENRRMKRNFFDMQTFCSRTTYTKDQIEFIKNLRKDDKNLSLRQIAKIHNEEFPLAQKTHQSIYRLIRQVHEIVVKGCNVYVPYCDENFDIKFKPKIAKIKVI